MQLIRKRATARAGLLGNPSDGYHGRTISLALEDFWAETILYEWDRVEILLSQEDQSRFASVGDLVEDVRLHGYYGGVRLVKATIKAFVEYCERQQLALHDRNFAVRYTTNIPRQVGLAGSSAIIVATLRSSGRVNSAELGERRIGPGARRLSEPRSFELSHMIRPPLGQPESACFSYGRASNAKGGRGDSFHIK